jgi:hypothetical protein
LRVEKTADLDCGHAWTLAGQDIGGTTLPDQTELALKQMPASAKITSPRCAPMQPIRAPAAASVTASSRNCCNRNHVAAFVSLVLTLLEKFLVNPFDVRRLLDAASDVVADHQTSEQNAIYHDDPFTQVLCSFLSNAAACRDDSSRIFSNYYGLRL